MRLRTSFYVSIVLAVVYFGMALFAPLDPALIEKYSISETKLRLLNFSIVIPLLAIWATAFYGFLQLKGYSQSVADSKEGPALNQLSTGLMLLAFSLPVTAIISNAFNIIILDNPSFEPSATVIKNYVSLLFALGAFYIISRGALLLADAFKISAKVSRRASDTAALLIIAFSCVVTWLVLYRPVIDGVKENVYFLPNWLVLFTIVIPYLFAWRAGAIGVQNLYRFHTNLKGLVYKFAFSDLAWGIGIVVTVSVLIQGITTISEQLNRLNLTPVLIVVYALLLLYAVGFGLIARGAKKLKKIEEV